MKSIITQTLEEVPLSKIKIGELFSFKGVFAEAVCMKVGTVHTKIISGSGVGDPYVVLDPGINTGRFWFAGYVTRPSDNNVQVIPLKQITPFEVSSK
jgi:hypothetical protein